MYVPRCLHMLVGMRVNGTICINYIIIFFPVAEILTIY